MKVTRHPSLTPRARSKGGDPDAIDIIRVVVMCVAPGQARAGAPSCARGARRLARRVRTPRTPSRPRPTGTGRAPRRSPAETTTTAGTGRRQTALIGTRRRRTQTAHRVACLPSRRRRQGDEAATTTATGRRRTALTHAQTRASRTPARRRPRANTRAPHTHRTRERTLYAHGTTKCAHKRTRTHTRTRTRHGRHLDEREQSLVRHARQEHELPLEVDDAAAAHGHRRVVLVRRVARERAPPARQVHARALQEQHARL